MLYCFSLFVYLLRSWKLKKGKKSMFAFVFWFLANFFFLIVFLFCFVLALFCLFVFCIVIVSLVELLLHWHYSLPATSVQDVVSQLMKDITWPTCIIIIDIWRHSSCQYFSKLQQTKLLSLEHITTNTQCKWYAYCRNMMNYVFTQYIVINNLSIIN